MTDEKEKDREKSKEEKQKKRNEVWQTERMESKKIIDKTERKDGYRKEVRFVVTYCATIYS